MVGNELVQVQVKQLLGSVTVPLYDIRPLFRLWSRQQTQISQKQHNMYTTAT
jgi:hypothetical protein